MNNITDIIADECGCYCVYIHTCPNGKVYIGITSQNPIARWQGGKGYRFQKHFYNAILKYGWDNIKHEILFDGMTKEEACNKEIELIAHYNSTNPQFGYNQSSGGECSSIGIHHTEEARKKMSIALKGKYVGENNHLYGKSFTEEHKRKISEANKGQTPWSKGKHLSEEHRRKIGEKHKKPVICKETNQVYSSPIEAEKATGISCKNIRACCQGASKTSGGYHWKYMEVN